MGEVRGYLRALLFLEVNIGSAVSLLNGEGRFRSEISGSGVCSQWVRQDPHRIGQLHAGLARHD